jgi:hypothetical protein
MRWMLLLVPLVVAVGAPAAYAHFDTGQYTHDEGCPVTDNDRVDPINFVFRDWGTIERAVNNLEWHADWDDSFGTHQAFVDHGDCYPQEADQRASATVVQTRDHIRLHPIHYDDGVGWTTVGDAHFEDIQTCGHAVRENGPTGSGYDEGRTDLWYAMDGESGHSGWFVWWGNTQNMRQCDSTADNPQ